MEGQCFFMGGTALKIPLSEGVYFQNTYESLTISLTSQNTVFTMQALKSWDTFQLCKLVFIGFASHKELSIAQDDRAWGTSFKCDSIGGGMPQDRPIC